MRAPERLVQVVIVFIHPSLSMMYFLGVELTTQLPSRIKLKYLLYSLAWCKKYNQSTRMKNSRVHQDSICLASCVHQIWDTAYHLKLQTIRRNLPYRPIPTSSQLHIWSNLGCIKLKSVGKIMMSLIDCSAYFFAAFTQYFLCFH